MSFRLTSLLKKLSMMETATKAPRIGTHSGIFHCDEALACFLLKLLPQYKNAEIIRSRDDSVLDTCDIVVDVGSRYDPSQHRYDHHQRGFNETVASVKPGKSWDIKLSSAGLVYCHFGMEILKELVPKSFDEKDLDAIFDYVYERFVQEIDAIDNGVTMCESEPRYKISTNLSSRVAYLNPSWNEPEEDPTSLERFKRAMALAGSEFLDRVQYASNSWWPARSYVLEAINGRHKVHESGQIMELKTACPWKEHYFDLMQKLKLDAGSVNFVIFSDGKTWRVQGVPESATSFVGKIFLHPAWRGLRDNELSQVSGIDGCVFAHASGFIGGNVTRDGALQMAVKSLKQDIPE